MCKLDVDFTYDFAGTCLGCTLLLHAYVLTRSFSMLDLTKENNNAHALPSCLRQIKEKCNMDHPSHRTIQWRTWVEKGMGHQRFEEPVITLWAVVAFTLGGPLLFIFGARCEQARAVCIVTPRVSTRRPDQSDWPVRIRPCKTASTPHCLRTY
jgi:hypothetical protein